MHDNTALADVRSVHGFTIAANWRSVRLRRLIQAIRRIANRKKFRMTRQQARLWIVKHSLIVTIVTFVFFALAPPLGYPLTFDQAIRIMEITTPVFLGYMGAAAQFLVKGWDSEEPPAAKREQGQLLHMLVKGPIVAFVVAGIAAVLAFYLSNRPTAQFGDGMSVDTLALFMSGALGLLTVTTNIIVAYLFHAPAADIASAGAGKSSEEASS
jgi:hypothetical protein